MSCGVIESHPFVAKYLSGSSTVTIDVAQGVSATLPLSRDVVGLALAELYQAADRIHDAISVIEELDPSVIAGVSLAELYIQVGRFDDVVELTNDLTNDGDPSALLLVFRGVALRELQHYGASREAFNAALKPTSRDKQIRNLAWLERGRTYQAEGKVAMARKDFEKVLALDSAFPGLQDALESLT
jgi:tetratricopeptide (TPR) repeat protein